MRIEIITKKLYEDGRSKKILQNFEDISGILHIDVSDVYIIDKGDSLDVSTIEAMICDSVAQDIFIDKPFTHSGDKGLIFEVSFKAGVTDPLAITLKSALKLEFGEDKTKNLVVQTAKQYIFTLQNDLASEKVQVIAKALHNPLIQRAEIRTFAELAANPLPRSYPIATVNDSQTPEIFDIQNFSDAKLVEFSTQRLLALSLEEMQVVRTYYTDPQVQSERLKAGLPVGATDLEIEMIAQSWSEHCKHKIFAADVDYEDTEAGKNTQIKSIFKTYIRKTTEILSKKRKDLRSMFHDNAGVVDFDKDTVVCFKVETHNSPSALDPYGGAITGIVGVNRDILGTGKGAAPIFNTNYLCFADPETPASEVPQGLLHPKVVMNGVHEGIVDGGNQSGIPTVAGGFLFDESYLGKPLVYCGTGGIMPRKILKENSWIKHIDKGDLAVMLGGRIGKDGIHGATFSSLALDETSPSSAVQIGDPITQRKVWDFLIEARDKGLYKGITDNGAGGLSSSLGEMAQYSGGIRVELDLCPLKYPGLSPWEIWVSESQERMSLSVDPLKIGELKNLAVERDVELTVIGEFTNSGFVELLFKKKMVGMLSMDFIHEGLPPMKTKAVWTRPRPMPVHPKLDGFGARQLHEILVKVLGHPNVRSKEDLVRVYDHEVQARTMVQGYKGINTDAPTDGSVITPVRSSKRGLSVTHGVCPRVGDYDTRHMAIMAVDEAYRSHIALGGDPNGASALDNFCWPDPIQSATNTDGQYKMAQLVRANIGLQEACIAYNTPLISGKDSMKNNARVGGKSIAVRPTLLISMMGIVKDISKTPASGFKKPSKVVALLGKIHETFAGSVFEHLVRNNGIEGISPESNLGHLPEINLEENKSFYEKVAKAISGKVFESIHDISDGGLITSVFESALHQRLGVQIDAQDKHSLYFLFGEHVSSYIVSLDEDQVKKAQKMFKARFTVIGKTIAEPRIEVNLSKNEVIKINLDDAANVYKKGWK